MTNDRRVKTGGMVDVSAKAVTRRVAVAEGGVELTPRTMEIFLRQGSPKGDVLETARVAGIMAAKNTPQIIPFCHPLELNKVNIAFEIDEKAPMIRVFSEVVCRGRTGVEMEALVAVTAAALTIYDMMKWADPAMILAPARLLAKTGGKSGTYRATGANPFGTGTKKRKAA